MPKPDAAKAPRERTTQLHLAAPWLSAPFQRAHAPVRHHLSSPAKKGSYAHVQLLDQTRALDALPAIDAPRANVAALAATGT